MIQIITMKMAEGAVEKIIEKCIGHIKTSITMSPIHLKAMLTNAYMQGVNDALENILKDKEALMRTIEK
jgi:hypothetical protein